MSGHLGGGRWHLPRCGCLEEQGQGENHEFCLGHIKREMPPSLASLACQAEKQKQDFGAERKVWIVDLNQRVIGLFRLLKTMDVKGVLKDRDPERTSPVTVNTLQVCE